MNVERCETVRVDGGEGLELVFVDRVVPGCNSLFLFRCDAAALLIIAAEIKRMFFGGHCSTPGGCGAYGTGMRCNEPTIE